MSILPSTSSSLASGARWVEARVSMERLLGRTLQIMDFIYENVVWA